MRLILPALLFVVAGVVIWRSGAAAEAAQWALAWQREFQNALAAGVQAAKRGEAGAILTVLAACGAYGFVHAVGPGHGKYVIGGLGVAKRIAVGKFVGLALATSIAQSLTAILLVYGGFALFSMTSSWAMTAAEAYLAPASYAAICIVGLYIAWRGARAFWRRAKPAKHVHHRHDNDHGRHHGHDHDECCGHAHGPTLEEAAEVVTWRQALAVIASVAIRPCTGAILLLAIAWRMDLLALGAAGTLVMGLGTGGFLILVALSTSFARRAALSPILAGQGVATAGATVQVVAGLFIAAASLLLILNAGGGAGPAGPLR